VRFHRKLVAATLLTFALAACDRGSRPEQVGKPAPDFTVSDSDRTVSLHDYRGKVVVLNFWATWCAPCIEEMPSLMKMQSDLNDKVTVLAVSTDKDESAYRQFLSDRHIHLLTVRDAAQKSNIAYGTTKFPETYIIDKHGAIQRKFIGAVKWTTPDIEKYLSQLAVQ
jgi:cytochrome c biogenesis protein CcmG/thiol:disulfide interchange protein DsbE